jgi:hypothetical protein
VTAPTPEQQAAGQRCLHHVLEVELLTSRGDIDGAMGYLAKVEHTEGTQMVRNIEALMTLRLRILPPEML